MEVKTASDYLSLLGRVYDETDYLNYSWVANEIWNRYEKQGTEKPTSLNEIISNTKNYYQSCFDRALIPIQNQLEIEKLFFGYFPIKNFNAFCNQTENKDFVVIFDEHLNSFLIQNFLAINILSFGEPSKTERNQILGYVQNNFYEFATRSKSKDSKKYDEVWLKLAAWDYDLMLWSSISSIAVMLFIFCHEFGHYSLGHIGNKSEFLHSNFAVDRFSHKNEFEADSFGMAKFLHIVENPVDSTFINITPDFDRMPLMYFEIMHLYYQWQIKIGLIKEVPKSHPEPKERILKLEEESNLSTIGLNLYEPLMKSINDLGRNIF